METNLDRLKETFGKMREDGFDVDNVLKWGFFFVGRDKNKLEQVFQEMADHDYVIEKLDEADKEWTLVASKIDTLNAEKLHKRNVAFNELANYYEVEYDGWDVEKIK